MPGVLMGTQLPEDRNPALLFEAPSPGPAGSSTVTAWPSRCRYSAQEMPTMPAPTTVTWREGLTGLLGHLPPAESFPAPRQPALVRSPPGKERTTVHSPLDKVAVAMGPKVFRHRPWKSRTTDLRGGARLPDRHKIVSHDRWLHARKQLLRKEKALTRLRDRLSRERRNLPWERVDKPYVFEGPDGKETLAQLFDGRRQLIVYHFMFAADWDAGCPSCSFWADNFDDNI